MVKVECEYVDSKQTGKHLKDIYDKQIDKLENNHEDEIIEIKQKHAETLQNLNEQYKKYQEEQKKITKERDALEVLKEEERKLMEKEHEKRRAAEAKLEEKIKQINMLE